MTLVGQELVTEVYKDRQSYTRDREALEKTQGGVLESPWLVEV